MADLSDVENALVTTLSAGIYPNGTTQPSVLNVGVKIRRGWPNSNQLDLDLAAGFVTITVYPLANATKNTTRFERFWDGEYETPSMAVWVYGSSVIWSGTPALGQITGVLFGGAAYTHQVTSSDTLATIAGAITAQISGATVSGQTMTLPSSGDAPIARVGLTSSAIEEIRRQEQLYQITIWAPTYLLRDACGAEIDQILAPIDFLTLADGTSAWLRFRSNKTDDVPTKDNLWRRDMRFSAEYPTIQKISATQILFGSIVLNGSQPYVVSTPQSTTPIIGAIRFDGFCASSSQAGSVASQNAAALSPSAYNYRLPFYATVSGGVGAQWSAQTQAQMDEEIQCAVDCGLNYWAFDSYQPTDEETAALELYLSSSIRGMMNFCMLGQFSNWNLSSGSPYSASAQRDVTMLAQSGYVTVLGGRPLYYVLGAGTRSQMAAAITWFRAQSVAQGTGNPYVVLLSGAALALYNNVGDAQVAGADAAGAYECPLLNGAPQPYANLAAAAAADWAARAQSDLPMVPLAMTDFDPRPLVQTPQSYYPVPAGWSLTNYYQQGSPAQIAAHIGAMRTWMLENNEANPSGAGLIYAWNELAEGGKGLMPTYIPGNVYGDVSRSIAVGQVLMETTNAY